MFLTESYEYRKQGSHPFLHNLMEQVETQTIGSILESIEKEIIESTLAQSHGNVAQAAKRLGMNRQTLDYRIKKLL